jgi:glycosyltransferase involved in cell wall biosynthesis
MAIKPPAQPRKTTPASPTAAATPAMPDAAATVTPTPIASVVWPTAVAHLAPMAPAMPIVPAPAPSLGLDPCFQPVMRLPLKGDRKRIRVVELLATGSNGGAQEHLFNLVTRIDRERYDVSVVSLTAGSAIRRLERTGIPVCVIDEPDDEAAIQAVATHLAAVDADVVHAHMYRAEVIGTQAAWRIAGLGRRRPYIVSTVHSSRIRSDEDRALLRRLTPRIDQLIAVSKAIVRKIDDEGRVGAPVTLIYNGVDLQRYVDQEACCTLHEEYDIPEGAPIVGVVARLEPEKGHPTLLEAWPGVLERVPSAHLLIVGEGSRREALEAQAIDLGLMQRQASRTNAAATASAATASAATASAATASARPASPLMQQQASRTDSALFSVRGTTPNSVTFTGRRDDIPSVTAALDVAVLPSYREAQGLSILEAMALSRPVVASNVGGIPEMIENGETGLLVPPHDAAALGDAIARLLTDHPYADTLARAGHDLVYERFCVELMVRAVETIYDEAVEGEGRLAG